MVDTPRLLRTFLDLVAIDSPSGQEAEAARFVAERLRSLGLAARQDTTGNVLASLPGEGSPLLLCAHLDNVPPCLGVKAIVEGDWVRSDGSTVLGADDKSGVAVILEALAVLKERGIPHLPLELALTVREEVGLSGAMALNLGAGRVSWGIVLDHGEPVEAVVVRAPSQNSLDVVLRGRAAHAGVEPEKGISAIQAAAEAIAAMPLGRIDEETTANVGTIQGGSARNIVPEKVRLQAEARSHDLGKLQAQTERMVQALQEKAAGLGARAEVQVSRAYAGYALSPDTEIVRRALAAGRALGLDLRLTSTGGGSDANVFNERGITTIIMSSGYRDNHTTQEAQHIPSLAKSARLLVEMLRAGA